MSIVSILPNNSEFSLNWLAISFKYFALSLGNNFGHSPSKAFCAALTALSTSFALASGTFAQGSLFSGLSVSKVLLLSDSTHDPSITFYIL